MSYETEMAAHHDAGDEHEVMRVLWEIYKIAGGDTDGDSGPEALIAGMGVLGFARLVRDEVSDLRAGCL